MAGYPWYKVHKLLNAVDIIPGLPISRIRSQELSGPCGRRAFPGVPAPQEKLLGGKNAWLDIYGLIGLSKLRFFNPDLLQTVSKRLPYEALNLNFERMKKWHPLNRSLYIGARVHFPGLLLNAKGDRVAMHSSVETRYPFLDEEVFAFLAGWIRAKMKGMRDKYLLRLLSERWLPKSIAWRRKAMFRAPVRQFPRERYAAFRGTIVEPRIARQNRVSSILRRLPNRARPSRALMRGSPQRAWVEMGLVGIIATQLWYHLFIDDSLCELPSWKAAGISTRSQTRSATEPAPVA